MENKKKHHCKNCGKCESQKVHDTSSRVESTPNSDEVLVYLWQLCSAIHDEYDVRRRFKEPNHKLEYLYYRLANAVHDKYDVCSRVKSTMERYSELMESIFGTSASTKQSESKVSESNKSKGSIVEIVFEFDKDNTDSFETSYMWLCHHPERIIPWIGVEQHINDKWQKFALTVSDTDSIDVITTGSGKVEAHLMLQSDRSAMFWRYCKLSNMQISKLGKALGNIRVTKALMSYDDQSPQEDIPISKDFVILR